MLYLITKALISGVIIMAASEAAKRSPTYGALVVSLPLISILAMVWLWRDTGDNKRIAALSERTFWLVLPTLPMFLVLPAMLRNGLAFWTALAASCALTVALYVMAVCNRDLRLIDLAERDLAGPYDRRFDVPAPNGAKVDSLHEPKQVNRFVV
jgi:hypothetical protein